MRRRSDARVVRVEAGVGLDDELISIHELIHELLSAGAGDARSVSGGTGRTAGRQA